MDIHEGLKQQEDFLKAWPPERVNNMTLEEYINLEREDSFCYWIESKTVKAGSIWGSPAYKFGIYQKGPRDYEIRSNASYDGKYVWMKKYGDNRDTAFQNVKKIIIETVNASVNKEFQKLDNIDIGNSIKWKIASLYARDTIMPIFKVEVLRRIANGHKIPFNEEKLSNFYTSILKYKSFNESPLLMADRLWEIYKLETFYPDLLLFIDQSKTDDLRTNNYLEKYEGLKIKVSFGQGNVARVPWIAFLNEPNTPQKGIYPVYLLYKSKDLLILSYGVSETNEPGFQWHFNKVMGDYFNNMIRIWKKRKLKKFQTILKGIPQPSPQPIKNLLYI
jgi:hypothetical protein